MFSEVLHGFILKASTVVAALLCIFPCQAARKEIGIQLYSVRSILNARNYPENQARVFKSLARMGYTFVEVANYGNGKFYGVSPEQFKSDVEAAGLKVLSSHINHGLSRNEYQSGDLTKALEWWKRAICAHKAAGMKYMVVPHSPVPATLAELKVYCGYLTEIGKLCAAEGIKFGYHNHSHEFQKVEGVVMYDYLLEHTDPEYVFFQMDLYWTVVGKAAPVEYFKRYPGRFTLLHVKDYREVGQSGMVGFDAIFNNVGIAGTKYFIVEIESSSYGDILRSCRESVGYLKDAKIVKASY